MHEIWRWSNLTLAFAVELAGLGTGHLSPDAPTMNDTVER